MMRGLFWLAFFAAGSAQAHWMKVPSKDFSVNPPPAKNSAEEKKDFRELHRWEAERTEADCALARKQREPHFEVLFGSSEILTDEEIESAKPLLDRVSKLGERIARYQKDRYSRERPYNVDKTLNPCAEKPMGSKAYPSSHAAVAALDACVLGSLFPARKKRLREYGAFLGELRARVGVHHPSDVAAGQALAADVCEYLLAEETFQEELAETKATLGDN